MPMLTSIQSIQALLPRTNASDELTLLGLANGASQWFVNYTHNNILAQDYDEEVDGLDELAIFASQIPVCKVYRVQMLRVPALQVNYTAGNASFASMDVEPTGITLQATVNGVPGSKTPLLFASYQTFTALAAAINSVSGWSASVQGVYGPWPTSETVEYGVRQVASTNVGAIGNNYLEVFSLDMPYRVKNDTGEIWSNYGFTRRGFKGYRLRYRSGFECLPSDVSDCVAEIAYVKWGMRDVNPNMTSRSLGQYSYSTAQDKTFKMLSPQSQQTLEYYRMRDIPNFRVI